MLNNTEKKENTYDYIIFLLGLMTGFGPFITDFYLPALPQISTDLMCTDSQTQLTLTMGMLGLGLGQFIIGPLSDRFGRKKPLVFSLLCFIGASWGCFITTQIDVLLVCRLIQGVAGGGSMVLSRAIAVDLYHGQKLLKTYSIIGSITAIAPITAPLIGGILLTMLSWQNLFLGLMFLGVFLLLATGPFIESLSLAHRNKLTILDIGRNYLNVLKNKTFLMYVGIQAFSHGVMFAYIASSPFIFQSYYGLTTFQYSLCFGINSVFLLIGSLLLMRVNDPKLALKKACQGLFIVSLLLGLCLIIQASFWLIEILIMISLFTLGILYPSSASLGLSLERKASGAASGIFGASSFLIGSIVAPLSGMGNMFVICAMIMMACSLMVWLCCKKID